MSGLYQSFWIALVIASAIAYPVLLMLRKLNARQTISQYVPEHAQKQGTPTMGGLIVIPGLILVLLLTPGGLAPAVLVFGFALIGFLDDYAVPKFIKDSRGLSWKPKLILELIIALGFSFWQSRDPSGNATWTAVGFSTFLILFASNAYNFSDGLDALSGTLLLAIAPAALCVLMFLQPAQPEAAALAACMALTAGILPFLLLNAPPAKVFMGDVGSLPIGAVLGWVFVRIWSSADGNGSLSISAPEISVLLLSAILLVELLPPPLQILSVKIRKKRLFPRTPIHHAFQDKGWPETRIVALFVVVQLICSAAAITVSGGKTLDSDWRSLNSSGGMR